MVDTWLKRHGTMDGLEVEGLFMMVPSIIRSRWRGYREQRKALALALDMVGRGGDRRAQASTWVGSEPVHKVRAGPHKSDVLQQFSDQEHLMTAPSSPAMVISDGPIHTSFPLSIGVHVSAPIFSTAGILLGQGENLERASLVSP